MGDRGDRRKALRREAGEALPEVAAWLNRIDEASGGKVSQEARDEVLGAVEGLGRDFELILEEAEDEVEQAESKAEDAEGAQAEAEEALGEVVSDQTCPVCWAPLLVGESILDSLNCQKCRAARERDAEFHRRNPGVRAAARAQDEAARDPLAGVL
jgi:hypothetical protein